MFQFDEPDPLRDDYTSVDEYCEAYFAWADRRKSQQNKRAKLMNPDNRFSQSSPEYKEICDEVIRQWKIFAPSCELERWIPDVSIQYKVKERWQNDEVVYYFTARDQFITQ